MELYDITADYFMIFIIKRTEEKLMVAPKGKNMHLLKLLTFYSTSQVFLNQRFLVKSIEY